MPGQKPNVEPCPPDEYTYFLDERIREPHLTVGVLYLFMSKAFVDEEVAAVKCPARIIDRNLGNGESLAVITFALLDQEHKPAVGFEWPISDGVLSANLPQPNWNIFSYFRESGLEDTGDDKDDKTRKTIYNPTKPVSVPRVLAPV